MKANDEDIKIFHPKKTDGAGADLAELAMLMDKFRSNGNMEKASALGKKLAALKPEMLCPKDAAKLNTNEVRQLRALIVFSVQIALHKYMQHPMLTSQVVNAMYAEISETAPGFFSNISNSSSVAFKNRLKLLLMRRAWFCACISDALNPIPKINAMVKIFLLEKIFK